MPLVLPRLTITVPITTLYLSFQGLHHSLNKSVYVFVMVNRALRLMEADCECSMLILASQCLLSDPWDLFRQGS